MSLFKKILTALWRIWFYLLLGTPIILMLPLLLITTSSEKFYPQFFVLARIWAKIIIYGMGFYPRFQKMEKLDHNQSYMLVANHTSMADIMLMLCLTKKPFVFVGKQELTRIPLFGFFYRRTCILVDRKSRQSKRDVFRQAQKRLDQGVNIFIFPEGGVSENRDLILDEFKDGAFRLAIDHQIPIAPIVIYDNKKRFSYTFLSGSPGIMRAKMLPFVSTQEKTAHDKRTLRCEVRTLILNELEKGPKWF